MKVGEFQDKLGVSASSYSSFMGQNGNTKGLYSDTFGSAAEFFKRRELAGVKMPRATKKAKATATNDAGAAGSDKSATAKGSSTKSSTSSQKRQE